MRFPANSQPWPGYLIMTQLSKPYPGLPVLGRIIPVTKCLVRANPILRGQQRSPWLLTTYTWTGPGMILQVWYTFPTWMVVSCGKFTRWIYHTWILWEMHVLLKLSDWSIYCHLSVPDTFLLLMVQKSPTTTWDVNKNPVNHSINYPTSTGLPDFWTINSMDPTNYTCCTNVSEATGSNHQVGELTRSLAASGGGNVSTTSEPPGTAGTTISSGGWKSPVGPEGENPINPPRTWTPGFLLLICFFSEKGWVTF